MQSPAPGGLNIAPPPTPPMISNRPGGGGGAVRTFGFEGGAPVSVERNPFQDLVQQSVGRDLPMFGYNLFAGVPTTFAPLDRIPVTPDYVVGPGDEIIIRAWGQVDIDFRAIVDRDGAINIPRVGSIPVSGMRFQDLHGYLKTAIGRIFRNFELSVTMGQLRSIQIFVVGHAARPGAYTVSSLSTLVNALFASGGPTTKGSMRSIQLKRRDKVVSEFDVYDLLLKGDKSKDVPLLPGDVIYIPPVGPLVAVSGSVNSPAIYELKGAATLSALLELAGGLAITAQGQKVTVERVVDRRARQVEEFPLDPNGLARTVRAGDLIQVQPLSPRFENVVTVRGNVATQARHPWREGLRVKDVVPDKEALIVPDYWVKRNMITRTPPTAVRQSREAVSEANLRTDVKHTLPEVNWDYAVVERLNLNDLTTMLIPFNLGRAILDGDPQQNVVLQPGDVITIFSKDDIQVPVARQTKFARLEGELRTPGVYQVLPGETLRQLVTRVGGLTPSAYVYGSEFTRESVRVAQQKRLEELVDRLAQEVERNAASNARNTLESGDTTQVQAQAESQRLLLRRMKETKATGRIVLDMPASRGDLRDLPDLPLEDGDRLVIPSRPSTVSVIGALYNQNTFIYDPSKRVSDYVSQAGGVTRYADSGRTYVVRADGSVLASSSTVFSMTSNARLMPGDTIVVPENLDRVRWTKELKDWSQIFYQFALGVAGLKVLRDF